MPTKRVPISRTPRLAWVEDMLAEGRPPPEWRDWQEYEAWRQGQLAVVGLPDPEIRARAAVVGRFEGVVALRVWAAARLSDDQPWG